MVAVGGKEMVAERLGLVKVEVDGEAALDVSLLKGSARHSVTRCCMPQVILRVVDSRNGSSTTRSQQKSHTRELRANCSILVAPCHSTCSKIDQAYGVDSACPLASAMSH